MYQSILPIISVENVTTLNYLKIPFTFSDKSYLDIYNSIFLFTIIIGVLVNIIVVLAYKTSYGKSSNNSRAFSFSQKYASMQSSNNCNFGHNSNNPRLGYGKKIDRRVSLAIPQGSTVILEEEKPTAHIQPRKQYSQSYYDRRQSAFVDSNRNRSLNSLTFVSFKDQATKKIRHTSCSYFILSLGCCDLIICALVLPATLIIESGYFHSYMVNFFSSTDGLYSDQVCSIGYYLIQIPLVVEIEILLTIAINRYSSVFQPIKIYLFDPNKLKLTLMSHILLSCFLSLPNLFFYVSNVKTAPVIFQGIQYDMGTNFIPTNQTIVYSFSSYCHIPEKLMHAYISYQLILFSLFSSSLLVISIVYIKVYRHIYKASCHQRCETMGRRASSTSSRLILNTNSDRRLSEYWNLRKQSLINSLVKNFCTEDNGKKSEGIQLKDIEFSLSSSPLKNIQEHDHETDDQNNNNNTVEIIENVNNNIKSFNSQNENDLKTDLGPKPKYEKRRGSCPVFHLNPGDFKEANKQLSLPGSSFLSDEKNRHATNLENKKQILAKHKLEKENVKKTNEIFKVIEVKPKRKISAVAANQAPFLLKSSIRRFSDLNSSSMKPAPNSNGVFHSELSISVNSCANTNNSVAIRRHTQKVYKHGKTARILGVATLAFAFTWAPYWYYIIKYSIFGNNKINIANLTDISDFLLIKILRSSFYLNYVLNAIFYSFVNRRFRQNVFALFQCILKKISSIFCCYPNGGCFESSSVEKTSKKQSSSQSFFE